MTCRTRVVLGLSISDPAKFFSEFVRLAEKESSLQLQVDRRVVPVSRFCQELTNDYFRDVIDLKILMNGNVVLAYHDSLDECFAEESVRDILDQLALHSLVSYKAWPLIES